jgi:tRNA pseudouridine38-40 synthase
VSYDGSNYRGFARTPQAISIEETIEDALEKLTSLKIKITAAGRTDAKVHAVAQALHFDVGFVVKTTSFLSGINKILPLDIRFNSLQLVSDNFHARFNVKSKEYHYTISLTPPSVFHSRYVSYYPLVNPELLIQASQDFLGTHDFYAFTPTPPAGKPTIKTIYRLEVKRENNYLILIFEGNGFLKYSIRNMVGTLIDIANGKKEPSIIKTLLASKTRQHASKTAAPQGLCLFRVNY